MAGKKKHGDVGGANRQLSDSFEQLIPSRIHKVSDNLEEVARLMQGDDYRLRFTEVRILAYLAENTSTSAMDISRDLRVDKAWISRLLLSLESKKLIAKNRDKSDSRIMLISLTGQGKLVADRTMEVARQTYSSIMSGIDEEFASELITKLEENLIGILMKLRF